jgi:NAD(P)-dependent dehydrogenase (short-subunit alcohol dehydrogenase family)
MEPLTDLAGKVAVVTGAASGIGAALARRWAAAGMAVVAADVAVPQLGRVVADLVAAGSRAVAVPTDVSDPAAVAALGQAALDAFGAIHLVCNNAGSLAMGPAWEVPLEDWRRVVDVNLFGVVHGIRTFVPLMIDQGGPAHIVNTASMGGLVSLPSIGPYVASKHAIVALSEVLVGDLAAVGAPIGVSVLCPGYVPSRLGSDDRDAPVPDPAPGQPSADDVADLVHDAVTTGRFYVLTHDGSTELVAQRMRAIVDGGDPTTVALPTP